MNVRKDQLTTCLKTLLDRKSVPMNLNGKPDAQQAEINALLHSVIRHAPRENYIEWFNRLEVALGDAAKTRGWPTEGEIRAAARTIEGVKSFRPANAEDTDPLEAIAARMNEGEAVGDSYFYGRLAVDLKARGLVSEDLLRQYRSSWYFRAKKEYGQDRALELERQLKARHEAAEQLSRDNARHAAPPPPVNRVKTYEWDGAA